MRHFIACALVVGAASGCALFEPADPAAAPEPPVVVDLRGYRVDLRAGQRVAFRLPGDPSSAHRWTLTDPVPPVLRADGVSRDEVLRAAVGNAPREEVWLFEAVEPGNGTLVFEYRPTREPAGREAAQRAIYRIEVR
jgi:predicted secreted protein